MVVSKANELDRTSISQKEPGGTRIDLSSFLWISLRILTPWQNHTT